MKIIMILFIKYLYSLRKIIINSGAALKSISAIDKLPLLLNNIVKLSSVISIYNVLYSFVYVLRSLKLS